MLQPYPHTFSGEQAVQEKGEFESLLSFLRERSISSYLEIGVARGDTFHEVVSQMPCGSSAIAVDYPEKSWGLLNSKDTLNDSVRNLQSVGYDARIVWGNSQSEDVIQSVSKYAPFDLIFIDGDHTYEGVKADFDNYYPMGKFIAFHDIANDMKRNSKGELIDVPIFWNEVKKKHNHREFVVEGSNMGIGILECLPAT